MRRGVKVGEGEQGERGDSKRCTLANLHGLTEREEREMGGSGAGNEKNPTGREKVGQERK